MFCFFGAWGGTVTTVSVWSSPTRHASYHLSFSVSSISPCFIYRLKLQRRKQRQDVKKQNTPRGQSSNTLLPEERKHSPPLFSLFHSRFLSFTLTAPLLPQSSSAPLWATFKDSKCEESSSVRVITADRNLPYSHSVQSALFINQLHVFCVVLRNLRPLYWKMLNFQPQQLTAV